jgi:hypothetical protein
MQHHVRRLHSSEHLTQPQLDSIGAQYCDHCGVICSTHNNGARHKTQCKRNQHASPSRDATRQVGRPGRSRSRSPDRQRAAVSLPPAGAACTSVGHVTAGTAPAPIRDPLTQPVTQHVTPLVMQRVPPPQTDAHADDLDLFIATLHDDNVDLFPRASQQPPTSMHTDIDAAMPEAEQPTANGALGCPHSHTMSAIVPAVEGLDIAGVGRTSGIASTGSIISS